MQFDLSKKVHRPSKKEIVLAALLPTHAQMLTLFAIYDQVVKVWSEATDKIVAAYETGNSNEIKAEIDRTSAAAQSVILLQIPVIGIWAARLEKVHQGRWVKSVLSATKIDLAPILSPSDMSAILKASADWNAALIKDISSEAQRRISNIVYAGLQQGTSRYEIAKQIVDATGMSRKRARNIAVDQTNKLTANLNKARQQQAGIDKYKWRHSAKLHARPVHLARNGKVFPWTGPGSVPPDDQPSIPPFCGCTAVPVVTFNEPTA